MKSITSFLTPHRVALSLLLIILGLGILLPLVPLANNPLHHDEALYAYWARLIASGQDLMLDTVPVDKPPLFIYTAALLFKILGTSNTAARMPSLIAGVAIIGLTYGLGKTLYGTRTGLLAALLTTLSPFIILFASTALTDPMMLAFVMASAWAAARKRPVLAGLSLGLAAAAKQQGVFFLPLVLGLLILRQGAGEQGSRGAGEKLRLAFLRLRSGQALRLRSGQALRLRSELALPKVSKGQTLILPFILTFTVMLLLPLVWDFSRTQRPGFWLQSSLSYGPVAFGPAQFTERLAGFIELLKFSADSPILTLIFLIGLPLLLLSGVILPRFSSPLHPRSPTPPHFLADWLLAGFCIAFVLFHALVTFQVWDRYLLGLIPLLALLMSRILHLPAMLIEWRQGDKPALPKVPNGETRGQACPEPAEWGDKERGRGGEGETEAESSPRSAVTHHSSRIAVIRHASRSFVITVIAFALALTLMAGPARQAVQSGYPIGGDRGAYYGAAEIAAYLRGHVGANATLYHRWLGTHWRYYLFRFPYDFRYWESAEDLAAQSAANAHGRQYIAFPAWQSTTSAQLALSDVGLSLSPVFKTYKPDGAPGIYLYQISLLPDKPSRKLNLRPESPYNSSNLASEQLPGR